MNPLAFGRRLLVVAGLSATALLPAAPARPPLEKPNVVLVLADDLGYADLGVNGCKDIPTPHIDSLAAHGVRCAQGYVSHPFCSPTRAALMTGRYQQRFGHENNPAWLPQDTRVGLPLDQVTLPQLMRKAGYVTGAIGKWHLGAAPCFHPLERGFDEYFGLLGGGHIYLPAVKGSAEYTIPLQRNREEVELKEYLTDELSREAAAFVRRHQDQPFFLYVAYNAPHTPLQASDKYRQRLASIPDERRRTYGAMICAVDDGVGQLLQALREGGLEERTLVVFLSDNGGPPPNVAPTDNTPFRGHKGSVFEGGIHVPFLLQWRGRLPAGRVFEPPVCAIDLLPTAVALAGGKIPDHPGLDGVDLLPYLLGTAKGSPHERLFWRAGGGTAWAVREGRYKLALPAGSAPLLFDLQADLGETRDLAPTQPEIVARLTQAYEAWNAGLVPPRWQSPQGGAARKAAAGAKPKP